MKQRLLWKLLLVTVVPVILVIIGIVWLAIDQLAADYFMVLMDKYMVSPTETHAAFLAAIHRYLLWASLAALALAVLCSYLLTRRVLSPLMQMAEASRQIAAGNFATRVEILSHDEVGEVGQAFNRMADSLEQIEGLRRRMVGDVAHELRTPLTNLRGYLEGLHDGILPADKPTFAMLQDETLRLVNLVDDLGQLARAEAARTYLKRETVDIAETLDQLQRLYAQGFTYRQIHVATHIDPRCVTIQADTDKLLQALRNLIDNALKYTPQGGRVEIEATPAEEAVRITFANSGPGIAEDDLPYIFERFYRTDASRSRDAGGAGIGLAIVRELVEAHGGRVGATSDSELTHIWLELPQAANGTNR